MPPTLVIADRGDAVCVGVGRLDPAGRDCVVPRAEPYAGELMVRRQGSRRRFAAVVGSSATRAELDLCRQPSSSRAHTRVASPCACRRPTRSAATRRSSSIDLGRPTRSPVLDRYPC